MFNNLLEQNLFSKTLVDMLGLKRDGKRAGHFRAHQVRTMIGVTPLMMLANVANSIIVLVFLYGQPLVPRASQETT